MAALALPGVERKLAAVILVQAVPSVELVTFLNLLKAGVLTQQGKHNFYNFPLFSGTENTRFISCVCARARVHRREAVA